MRKVLLFLLFLAPVMAFAQYPNSPNKMRLGNQTTGDGLVFRGNGAPAYTPTGINNAWLYLDTVGQALYFHVGGVWSAAAGSDGNGLFSISNDGDTVRVNVAIVPDGSGLTFRDTTGTVFLSITDNSVTAIAGDAGIQAVKSLGYTLIKGDSLLFQIGGSYGTSGQVITATGDGGAGWGTPSGVGEVNTASNLGSGTGLFAGKVGVDLQFKSIVVGPNLSVSSNSTTVTISHSYSYYTNDAAAASGGVAIGGVYKVDIGNPYGMTWGTLKTRNE